MILRFSLSVATLCVICISLGVVEGHNHVNSTTQWKGACNGLHCNCWENSHCNGAPNLECKRANPNTEKHCVPKGAPPTPVPKLVAGKQGLGAPPLSGVSIAGIVIGILVLLAAVIACAFTVRRKRSNNMPQPLGGDVEVGVDNTF